MSEFPNCEIKLCDLEVSRVIQEHEQIREIIGTPDYVGNTLVLFYINIFYPCYSAPEILAYEPISLAADIWSLGVLAYVLLTGFSPFGGEIIIICFRMKCSQYIYRGNGSGDSSQYYISSSGLPSRAL